MATWKTGSAGKANVSGPGRIIGALFTSLFFVVFAGMGGLFLFLLGGEVIEIAGTYSWQKTPCTIVASSVDSSDTANSDDNNPYNVTVRYKYAFDGQAFASTTFMNGYDGESSIAEAERIAAQLMAAPERYCYVNPELPSQAVLRRQPLFIAFFIIIPLIFLAVGLGGIWFTWHKVAVPKDKPQALSTKASSKVSGKTVGIIVATVFFLIGVIATPLWTIPTVSNAVASKSWPQVPCQILSSRVERHSDSDGTTYSVDIVYSYQIDGREYKSDRYDLLGGSSSGRSSKQRIVDQYPKGSQAVCFVSPDDPTQAVLSPGFKPIYLISFLPVLFGLIGAGLLVGLLRGKNHKQKYQNLARSDHPHAGAPSERTVIKGGQGRLTKVFGTLGVGLFWNGIVSVFVFHVIEEWNTGAKPWFLTLFLVPFVAVGVGIIIYFIRALMQLANPKVELALAPGSPRLGDPLAVEWRINGNSSRIKKLEVILEGREEAQYRRGTSTYTDKNVFHSFPVISETSPSGMPQGVRQAYIPAESVPSLDLPNNKIIWELKTKGDIPGWPDISDNHVLQVLPMVVHS